LDLTTVGKIDASFGGSLGLVLEILRNIISVFTFSATSSEINLAFFTDALGFLFSGDTRDDGIVGETKRHGRFIHTTAEAGELQTEILFAEFSTRETFVIFIVRIITDFTREFTKIDRSFGSEARDETFLAFTSTISTNARIETKSESFSVGEHFLEFSGFLVSVLGVLGGAVGIEADVRAIFDLDAHLFSGIEKCVRVLKILETTRGESRQPAIEEAVQEASDLNLEVVRKFEGDLGVGHLFVDCVLGGLFAAVAVIHVELDLQEHFLQGFRFNQNLVTEEQQVITLVGELSDDVNGLIFELVVQGTDVEAFEVNLTFIIPEFVFKKRDIETRSISDDSVAASIDSGGTTAASILLLVMFFSSGVGRGSIEGEDGKMFTDRSVVIVKAFDEGISDGLSVRSASDDEANDGRTFSDGQDENVFRIDFHISSDVLDEFFSIEIAERSIEAESDGSGASRRSSETFFAVGKELSLAQVSTLAGKSSSLSVEEIETTVAVARFGGAEVIPRLATEVPETEDDGADEHQETTRERTDEDPVRFEQDVSVTVDGHLNERALSDSHEGGGRATFVDGDNTNDGEKVGLGVVSEDVHTRIIEGVEEDGDVEKRSSHLLAEITEGGVVEVGIGVEETVLQVNGVVSARRIRNVEHHCITKIQANDRVLQSTSVVFGRSSTLEVTGTTRIVGTIVAASSNNTTGGVQGGVGLQEERLGRIVNTENALRSEHHHADSAVGASKTASLLSDRGSTSEVESGDFTRSAVVETESVGECVHAHVVGLVSALLIANFIFRLKNTARADTDLSVDDACLRIVAHLTERSLVDRIGGVDTRTRESAELTRRATRINDGLAREGGIFLGETLTIGVEDVSRNAAAGTIIRLEDTVATKTVTNSGAFGRSSRLTAATAASHGKVRIVETDIALEASADGTTTSSVVEAARRARSGRRTSSGAVVTNRADVTLVNLNAGGIASVGATDANVTSRARFAPERVGRPETNRARDTRILSVEAKNCVVARNCTSRAEKRRLGSSRTVSTIPAESW
jgi:hypothetical protein